MLICTLNRWVESRQFKEEVWNKTSKVLNVIISSFTNAYHRSQTELLIINKIYRGKTINLLIKNTSNLKAFNRKNSSVLKLLMSLVSQLILNRCHLTLTQAMFLWNERLLKKDKWFINSQLSKRWFNSKCPLRNKRTTIFQWSWLWAISWLKGRTARSELLWAFTNRRNPNTKTLNSTSDFVVYQLLFIQPT